MPPTKTYLIHYSSYNGWGSERNRSALVKLVHGDPPEAWVKNINRKLDEYDDIFTFISAHEITSELNDADFEALNNAL